MAIRPTILRAIDLASLAAAFLISFFLRFAIFPIDGFREIIFNPLFYSIGFVFSAIALLAIMSGFRLYECRDIRLSARLFTVLKACGTWILIVALIVYAVKFDFSRGIFFMAALLTAVFITISRYLEFRNWLRHAKEMDMEIKIIGNGNRALEIEKQLKDVFPRSYVKKMAIRDKNDRRTLANAPSEEIIIADETLGRDDVMMILADDRFKHLNFRVIIDTFKLATGEVRLNNIDDIETISPSKNPNIAYLAAKRLIDFSLATIGIIATLPVWMFISVAIKADSKGPVLIRQARVGHNGRRFTMLKFRTMATDSHLYERAPFHDDDPRITRVGRFLRHSSLDELPQLWNIVKGEMSFVGPRPEMEFIVRDYEPWQEVRLKAKPGLTGLWQILGRKDIPLHKNLEYDFYYVNNRSFLLDSTILIKTIPAVLFGRGAY